MIGLKDFSCDCPDCKKLCSYRPCWPTPKESQRIIKAGLGNRLMLDWWVGPPNIYLVSPAIVGYEGQKAPFDPHGECTFQDENGLCELHDMGLKPIEGRVGGCKQVQNLAKLHEMVSLSWKIGFGYELVKAWMKEYDILQKDDDEDDIQGIISLIDRMFLRSEN